MHNPNEADQTVTGRLLSGRLLARNTVWNFFGMAAPMLVALFTIPMVIHGMGKDRYGLLGIIWMVVGYFGLFDMGVGRALTKFVAEYLGKGKAEELPKIIWTALWMIFGLGGIGMLIGLLASAPLVTQVLNVPQSLLNEGVVSLRIASLTIPIVILTAALIGILEAHQKFFVITTVRVPLGVMTYLGPVISLQFTPSLVAATGVLAGARIVAMLWYFVCVLNVSPGLQVPRRISRSYVRKLFSFGGWITISNVISPLMNYMDRFFIGAILTMTAVAYYTTPYSVLNSLQIVPTAILGVMFPAMTTALNVNRERLPQLFRRLSSVLFLLMFPLTSFITLFTPEFLQIWLGSDFRNASTFVMQMMAFGWMVNSFARPSSTILQSSGRPDIATKAYICEILPYLVTLYYLTMHFGIAGAAITWFLRMAADTIIFNEMTKRVLSDLKTIVHRDYRYLLLVVVVFPLFMFATPLFLRILLYLAILAGVGFKLWPLYTKWRESRVC